MQLSLWAIIIVAFGLAIVALGFITLNRYIAYKERVALARLGFSLEVLQRDAAAKTRGSRGVLWGGVITAMSGLALLLGLATLGTGVWLLAGLLPLFVGLGMVLIYFLTLGTAPTLEDEGAAKALEMGAEHTGDQFGDGAEMMPFARDNGDAETSELRGGQDSPGC